MYAQQPGIEPGTEYVLNKYVLHSWLQDSLESKFAFRISIFLRFPPLPSNLSVLVCLLIFAWVFVIATEKLLVGILRGLG